VNRVAIPLAPSIGLSVATSATAALGAAGILDASFVGLPTCMFAATTGVPCPFCGLTHGVAALGARHVGTALSLHPLAPLAALLALSVPVGLLWRRDLAVPAAALWSLAAIVPLSSRGEATAGKILGIAACALSILMIALFVVLIAAGSSISTVP
jgi:hypothetical protein